jgi:hypothetical protein
MAEVPITAIYNELERLLKGQEIECHGFGNIHANNSGDKITLISFYFSKPGYDVGILNPVVVNTLKTLGHVSFVDTIYYSNTNDNDKGYVQGYVHIYTKEYMDKIMNIIYEELNKAINNGNQEKIVETQNKIAEFTEEYNQNWFCNGCPTPSEYVLK